MQPWSAAALACFEEYLGPEKEVSTSGKAASMEETEESPLVWNTKNTKKGRWVVSRKKQENGKKNYSRSIKSWTEAIGQARKILNVKGFVAVRKDTALYKVTMQLYKDSIVLDQQLKEAELQERGDPRDHQWLQL